MKAKHDITVYSGSLTGAAGRWAEFIREYFIYLRIERQTTEKTTAIYRRVLAAMFTYFSDNDLQPGKLSFQRWKETLIAQGLSVRTVNLYLVIGKALFRWLDESGRYANDVLLVRNLRIESGHARGYIRREWLETILHDAPTDTVKGLRNRAALAVLAFCGLRVFELSGLMRRDFKLIGNAYWLEVTGKARHHSERVAIPDAAAQEVIIYLNALKAEHDHTAADPLFVSLSNNNKYGAWGVRSLQRTISNYLDKLPITTDTRKTISAHSLRHSFVTWQLKGGEDIRIVQRRARHKSSKTTEIYAHDIDTENAWNGIDTALAGYTDILTQKGTIYAN